MQLFRHRAWRAAAGLRQQIFDHIADADRRGRLQADRRWQVGQRITPDRIDEPHMNPGADAGPVMADAVPSAGRDEQAFARTENGDGLPAHLAEVGTVADPHEDRLRTLPPTVVMRGDGVAGSSEAAHEGEGLLSIRLCSSVHRECAYGFPPANVSRSSPEDPASVGDGSRSIAAQLFHSPILSDRNRTVAALRAPPGTDPTAPRRRASLRAGRWSAA